MSRVLVSFLGTSNPKKQESGYRQYRDANYTFSDGECITSSFIAKTLKTHYCIDRVILIGTLKSMWEEAYYAFSGKLDDIYTEIGEFCESANHETEITKFPHKEDIESVLGLGSHVVLVKYGLNESEMNENSKAILSLEQYLEDGDELFVDITHSFRSLPLLLMNSLIFLQSVSQKNISIRTVSYGMLDITLEMGYTPVIELNSILNMNNWISGAAQFTESGNAYKIADLLMASSQSTMSDKRASRILRSFSDAVNFNYIGSIQTQVKRLKSIDFEEMSDYGRLLVAPVVNRFLDKFKRAKLLSQYQYYLAEFQFEQKHYASTALCLSEAFVSFVAECLGLTTSHEHRNNAKSNLKGTWGKQTVLDNYFEKYASKLKRDGAPIFTAKELGVDQSCSEATLLKLSFRKCYNDLNAFRIEVAHSISGNHSLSRMIHLLDDSLKCLRVYVKMDARA